MLNRAPPAAAAVPAAAPTSRWSLHASCWSGSRRAETAAASRCESLPPPGAILKPSTTGALVSPGWGARPWAKHHHFPPRLPPFHAFSSLLLRFGFTPTRHRTSPKRKTTAGPSVALSHFFDACRWLSVLFSPFFSLRLLFPNSLFSHWTGFSNSLLIPLSSKPATPFFLFFSLSIATGTSAYRRIDYTLSPSTPTLIPTATILLFLLHDNPRRTRVGIYSPKDAGRHRFFWRLGRRIHSRRVREHESLIGQPPAVSRALPKKVPSRP